MRMNYVRVFLWKMNESEPFDEASRITTDEVKIIRFGWPARQSTERSLTSVCTASGVKTA